MEKYYVTTAIAYPNAKPHLGHALEIVQADTLARFQKILKKDVFFQTGTDEHGTKNWQTAKKEGKEIMQFLDENVSLFKELYRKLNVEYDNFLRTSDKKVHYPAVQKLWNVLFKNEDIYKKKYKGMYCSGCETFKTERELENGKCINHPTTKIEEIEEENYFFRLSKYKDELIKIIEKDEYQIIPKVRKNEILSWLSEAKDISFSRPKKTLPWGIPVPNDDSQVMYVWCDALSNYITGIGYENNSEKFRKYWPCDAHIIGKDILRFHAAFWPAMLLSAKIPLPKKLFVHGFILSKGTKMSKSTGNVIEPLDQIEKFGVDQFRFYILGAMSLDGDGEYTEDLITERINTELVGNLANFFYRILSFLNKNFNSEIKGIEENKIIKEIEEKIRTIKTDYENFDFKKTIEEILAISALGNKYFQENEPWKLIKVDKNKAQQILGTCVNIAKNLSILLSPIMPEFSKKIQEQLNLKEISYDDINFELKNHKINEAKILFGKAELKKNAKDAKGEGKEGKEGKNNKKADFSILNLKVAKILECKDHPNANKLFVMQIDLGDEKRQLVAGLRAYYNAENLIDKKIIVVTNLKPAKLRGFASRGMLLAADNKKEVKLIILEKSNLGEQVIIDSFEPSEKQIDFNDFMKLEITTKDKKVVSGGKQLKTKSEEITIDISDDARVR